MQIEPIPAGPRRRAWGSTQLLHEWLTLKYPNAQAYYELRLGPTTTRLVGVQVSAALEAMLRVNNWYADAVVIAPPEILLIEAKVNPDPGAIGQVLFYLRLLPSTPLLAGLQSMPIVPMVLFAEDNPDVNNFARGLGVRVEVYTPPWIAQYLVAVQFKRRSTPPTV